MCHLKIFLLSFKVMDVEVFAFSECFLVCLFFTPPRNRGGVIFSLLFVCVCVCVCVSVCPALLVNIIPAERMHRFGRGFR